MVVFTCNNCGDSLQKPKVAKHYQFQCRNGISLTCVDCFKDFIGDEYSTHTKCITEAERYGGKDYKAKPSANKGERKQQEWINVVQNVLTNSTDLSQSERSFLQSISRHENIPRKKAKFLNFVKNAVGHRVNMNIVESCWIKMETAFKGSTEENKSEKKHGKIEETPIVQKTEGSEDNNLAENENNENISRENVDETRDKENTTENGVESNDKRKKHKKGGKKRGLECEDEKNEPAVKKKTLDPSTPAEVLKTPAETKFCWKSTILEVLGDREEISLKKIRKKVVGRYLQHVGDGTTREKAVTRFDKKIKKMSQLVLLEDKVKRAQ